MKYSSFLVRAFFLCTLLVCISFNATNVHAKASLVAVFPFSVDANAEYSYLRDGLPQMLRERLSNRGITTASEKEINEALGSSKKIPNRTSMTQLAKKVNAKFVMYGKYTQIDSDFVLEISVYDSTAKSAKIRSFRVRKSGIIQLLPAVDELVNKLRPSLLGKNQIASIRIEGLQAKEESEIREKLKIQVGDGFNRENLHKELKNLYGLGYFEDVTIKAEDAEVGKEIIIEVVEKGRVKAVRLEGVDALDEDDIFGAIVSRNGAVINQKMIATDINTIKQLYRTEGFYNAEVEKKLISAENNTAEVVFVVKEGKKLYIKDIVFEGSKSFTSRELRKILTSKEKTLVFFIDDSGILKEENLERDTGALLGFYQNKGFLNARVGFPDIKLEETGITITFPVSEGKRFRVEDVIFSGDLIVDSAELKKISQSAKLSETNAYLDRDLVRTDIEQIRNFYNNQGFAFAEVGILTKEGLGKENIILEFQIKKKQPVRVRRVIVEGNTETRDNVILRELRLADGDLYNASKINRSTVRLNRLDFFSAVAIEQVPTADDSLVDLKVSVQDKSTGKVSGGIGYSSYDGIFLTASLSQANLFGRGYYAGIDAQLGQLTTTFNLRFFNPRLNDGDLGFGLSGWIREVEYNTYDRSSAGGGFDFRYPLGEYSYLSYGYRLEQYNLFNIDATASPQIFADAGEHIASVGFLGISRDTTNHPVNPTEGTQIKLNFDYGGGLLGGTDDYIKYSGTVNWFKDLFAGVVFHWRSSFGYIQNNFGGERIPADQRFEIGGINTVRGYDTYAITTIDSEGRLLGGNKMFFTNVELLIPLHKEMGLGAVVFFDAGGVWGDDQYFFDPSIFASEDPPALGLYKSIGVGIRWMSPLGLLRIEYGYGLDELYGSDNQRVEFTIGQSF